METKVACLIESIIQTDTEFNEHGLSRESSYVKGYDLLSTSISVMKSAFANTPYEPAADGPLLRLNSPSGKGMGRG